MKREKGGLVRTVMSRRLSWPQRMVRNLLELHIYLLPALEFYIYFYIYGVWQTGVLSRVSYRSVLKSHSISLSINMS